MLLGAKVRNKLTGVEGFVWDIQEHGVMVWTMDGQWVNVAYPEFLEVV